MSPLWTQLLIALVAVPLFAALHGVGLMIVTYGFNLRDERLQRKQFTWASHFLLALIGFSLFLVHAVEIAVFAAFYQAVGAIPDFERALFVSGSFYTTVGASEASLPDAWKLMGTLEALLGLLLVGWSTAYLVQKINKLKE